jgi:uncharacterized repeat protein (TIGR02543 family)
VGWYTDPAAGAQIGADSEVTFQQDATLYAHWQQRHFINVTFDPNGGSIDTQSGRYEYGKTYESLPTPSRYDYAFTGWYTDPAAGTQVIEDGAVAFQQDTTLYAHWVKTHITVAFNPNGGTVDTQSSRYECWKIYGSLPTPVRAEHDFLGWFTGSAGGTQIGADSEVTFQQDVTLYAHWQQRHFVTIIFNPNGGTVSQQNGRYESGKTYGSLPAPSRSEHNFIGWYTAKSGGDLITNDSVMAFGKDTTIYAHWIKPYFTITFNPNGGTVGTQSKSYEYKKTYGSLPTPDRAEHTFLGWYTEPVKGTRVTVGSEVTFQKDTTLYAHWELRKTIGLTELAPFTWSGDQDGWSVYSNWRDNENVLHLHRAIGSSNINNNYSVITASPPPTQTYLVDGKYKTFSGKIALGYEDRATAVRVKYQIYGDNVLLYSSPDVTSGVRPFDISVDITGVEFLKFERISNQTSDEMDIAIINPTLTR